MPNSNEELNPNDLAWEVVNLLLEAYAEAAEGGTHPGYVEWDDVDLAYEKSVEAMNAFHAALRASGL